jgi:hypothetical protein
MKTKLAGLICLFVLCAQMHVLADNSPASDHYFVHFKDHEVLSEIEYDHDGNFIASERYYKDADLLPLHLAWELHKKFADKSIFGITETNTETDTYYYVKLEDSKQWMTIKGSSDGIVQVVEKFNKQL